MRILATTNLNQTQAAIKAGYSPQSANQISAETLARPCVRAALMKAIDRLDVTGRFIRNWDTLLDLPMTPVDENDKDAIARMTIVLKAQDQIARIAGLEAPKQSQRAVGHFDAGSLLPRGDVVRTEIVPESDDTDPTPTPLLP